MSYILDALKKLEYDKARKERSQHGITCIAGELLREESVTPAERRPWQVSLLVLAVALLAAGGTWLLLRGGTRNLPPTPIASAVTPVQPPAVAKVLPSTLPPVHDVPPPSAAAQAKMVAVPAPPREMQQPAAKARRNIEPAVRAGAAQRHAQLDSGAVPRQNAAAALAAPADIKISGIAWQDERSARRAVINGFLVHEGSAVAGYKVVDILQDRVRLSQSGRILEAPLIAAAMAVGGR